MILNSMLSHSPVFLFCLSGLVLGAYGALRLLQAGLRFGRRMLAH